ISTITTSAQDSFSLNGKTYTQSGSYTQTLKNSEGCDSTITLLLTITTTGVFEFTNNTEFSVYPNPSSGKFNIEMNGIHDVSSNTEFKLYNVLGEKVFSANLTNPKTEIEPHLQCGVYVFHLKNDNSIIFVGKIMIQ
ncbi:MAG: T9SS type A sorting domain-containing protein, partial [Bacteroidetes bacterium]|nr:T9SS type A sorting domain-containing protein [Bacteroidota bacterium]